ncbi:MAG: UvrD-helicase domain-containing protein [Chloroflexota bacterium]
MTIAPSTAARAADGLLASLDPEQRAAAMLPDGPALIIAPAGSGKTTTLIARLGVLVDRRVAADRIGVVTFNRDAAAELAARVAGRLAPYVPGAAAIEVRTLHAMARQVLLDAGRPVRLLPDRLYLLRAARGRHGLARRRADARPCRPPRAVESGVGVLVFGAWLVLVAILEPAVHPPAGIILRHQMRGGRPMGGAGIRRAIDAASAYLREHPEEARSTDSAATARLVEGLVVRVTGPGDASITTDMVRSVGGTATAPSPGWLLRAAEASCVVTLIAMRAAVLGLALDKVEVTVDSESDDRGLLGLDETVPAGPLSGRVSVALAAAGVDPDTLEEIARWGVKHCPVCDALERTVPVLTEVSTS